METLDKLAALKQVDKISLTLNTVKSYDNHVLGLD